MSYTNMIMFSSVLPSYNDESTKEKEKENETINADDPANQELVRKELFG